MNMQTRNLSNQALQLLERVSNFLSSRGVKFYLVGGWVRDVLLGRPSYDIDLAIKDTAEVLASEFAREFGGKFVLLDEVNQVARVVFPKQGVYLDFATFHDSIEEDLARRDFTVNAIALRYEDFLAARRSGQGAEFRLIDPFEGQQDLQRRLIRAVRPTIFREDPGRLLRAIRLAAELDFEVEENTRRLIQQDRELIRLTAAERIHEELMKLLETPNSARWLYELDHLGLLLLLFPELQEGKGVEQPPEHAFDVFEHQLQTVTAVERLLRSLKQADGLLEDFPLASRFKDYFEERISGHPRLVLLKLAALLHDVAKPRTKTLENGRIRFLGHAKEGARLASAMLERLRFSSRERKLVCQLITHHLRPGQLANLDEPPTHRAIYRYFRDLGEVAIDTLFLSLADHLATRGPQLDPKGWRKHLSGTQYLVARRLEEESRVLPPKLISGYDLMAQFGLQPGPQIGKLLELVREAQAEGKVKTKEEALELVRKELCTEGIK